jgi:mono/diheme cytochrome c family protein
MPEYRSLWRACARARQFSFALFLLSLALSACSLAGDVTPPPGSNSSLSSGPVSTGQPVTGGGEGTAPTEAAPTSATSALFPASLPAAQAGGLLYIQHCTPCHGDKGAGDGNMVTKLPKPPPDFSNAATLRGLTPQVIFNAITQGNTQALMPPFGSTLTDGERWSLVSFLYTLSTPASQLAAGQAVYTANCANCHGADGLGKGPDAAKQPKPAPSFADQSFMATNSQQDFFKVVSGGDAAHPFTNLSETDRWAALDVARAFAYVYSAPEQLTAEHQGAVTGKVVNSTPQGSVPAGLPVTLHSFDGQNLLGTFTTTLGADSSFQFANIPFTGSRQFIATTVYNDVTYASQAGTFDLSSSTLSMTLPIYETTSDASVLAVDQAHVIMQFNSPNQVTLNQIFVFSNHGNKTYSATGSNPLSFNLPAGATNVTVQNAEQDKTFFISGNTLSVLWSIPPGQGSSQVLYSFDLPYTDKLDIEQKMSYPVSNVDVLVLDLGVQVTGNGIQNLGVQNFQGQSFQNFSAGALAAGQTLGLLVAGKAGTGATTPTTTGTAVLNNPTATLAIGLGALALVLAGIGVWVYRRPRAGTQTARAQTAHTKEDLLEAIAELDDAYAAGEVTEAAYQKERGQLKRDLKKVWE